ncbi:hypothetical protein WICMUC_002615 [Wickerhamomyces mucosus]|uniref:Peptidase A1 domain-containing protein n=1 Tax=Wickerhamomyces mucosus TaxID=1378264 RepID=A0A9P8TE36_9ASCO|nr:hypothetical protein WICMUC_002615 [Wickerhamomyces mucosus]
MKLTNLYSIACFLASTHGSSISENDTPGILEIPLVYDLGFYSGGFVGTSANEVIFSLDTTSPDIKISNASITSSAFSTINSSSDLWEHYDLSFFTSSGQTFTFDDIDFEIVNADIPVSLFGIGSLQQESEPHSNFFQTIVQDQIVESEIYSLFLNHKPDPFSDSSAITNNATLLIGGIDRSKFTGDLIRVPTLNDRLEISIDAITVSNKTYHTGSLRAVINSTNPITLLPEFSVNGIFDTVLGQPLRYDDFGLAVIECPENELPEVQFGLGSNATLSLSLSQIIASNGDGTCTVALGISDSYTFYFGANALASFYTAVDLRNNWFAFATAAYGTEAEIEVVSDLSEVSFGIDYSNLTYWQGSSSSHYTSKTSAPSSSGSLIVSSSGSFITSSIVSSPASPSASSSSASSSSASSSSASSSSLPNLLLSSNFTPSTLSVATAPEYSIPISSGLSTFNSLTSTDVFSNSSFTSTLNVDDDSTTLVTITSCSHDICSITEITTGVTIVTETNLGEVTIFATYCPLTTEFSAEEAIPSTGHLEATTTTTKILLNQSASTSIIPTIKLKESTSKVSDRIISATKAGKETITADTVSTTFISPAASLSSVDSSTIKPQTAASSDTTTTAVISTYTGSATKLIVSCINLIPFLLLLL